MSQRSCDRRTVLKWMAGSGAAALSGGAWGQSAATLLTATDVHVGNYPTVEAVRWIGQQLDERTSGRLALRIYHSGQLGRELDQVSMARHGAIDLTRVYSGGLNNAFPQTIALGLPYVFEDGAHLRRVIDGAVGAQILASFEARGLIGLAIYDCGARCIYNTRGPLHTPDDLHGLKLRVPPSDIFLDLLQGFGANPTPLPFGEVFSGLETRLIDGAENNIRSFHSSRQFELARYWSETRHSWAPDVLLMSARRFQRLSSADQTLIRELGAASVAVMRTHWDAGEAQARAAVVESGVAINEVDTEAFRRAAQPLVERYRARSDLAELLNQIEAERT
jgi:tripartite ATP-independent transporter DctP family solute receptor